MILTNSSLEEDVRETGAEFSPFENPSMKGNYGWESSRWTGRHSMRFSKTILSHRELTTKKHFPEGRCKIILRVYYFRSSGMTTTTPETMFNYEAEMTSFYPLEKIQSGPETRKIYWWTKRGTWVVSNWSELNDPHFHFQLLFARTGAECTRMYKKYI